MNESKRPRSHRAQQGDDRQAVGRRQRLDRALRGCELLMVAGGLACLVFYGAACAHSSFYQAARSSAFERSLAAAMQAEQPDQSDWAAERVRRFELSLGEPVSALGRLLVPAAGISVMVLDGTDDRTLDRGVGRIEGTAAPGEAGNFGIAGHRDGFFRGLRHVKAGDELRFASLEGLTRYRIEEPRIVEPEDVEVLDPTERPAITLVTCYPFYFVGPAPKRLIVRAYQTSFEPWTPELLATFDTTFEASRETVALK